LKTPSPLILTFRQGRRQSALHAVGNVRLGADQNPPWNPDNPLVRPAARPERQLPYRGLGDIRADNGEVAVIQFKDVRATIQARGLLAVGMRPRAKSSNEHTLVVPIGTYPVNYFLLYAYVVAKAKPEIVGSSVARLLREKRETLGLSMNVVAARSGLSHSMVSRVERELRRPTLDTLLRITQAMGIDLWPLIKKAEAADGASKPKES
jgi:helix-turn-helix protein